MAFRMLACFFCSITLHVLTYCHVDVQCASLKTGTVKTPLFSIAQPLPVYADLIVYS